MNKKLIALFLVLIAALFWIFQGSSSSFYGGDGGIIAPAEKIVCDMTIDVDSIINPRCVNTHNRCLSFNTAPFGIISTEVTVVISDGLKSETEPFEVSKLGTNKNIQMSLCSKTDPSEISIKLLRDGLIKDSTKATVG